MLPQPLTILKTPIHFESGKWIKIQVLLDDVEMSQLFEHLSPFWIYLTSSLVRKGEETISHASFLECYKKYIYNLKEGRLLPIEEYRPYFSTLWTAASDSLYALESAGNQYIVRNVKPVIQLRNHCMDYSTFDFKFREMVFGPDSIAWGIQFAYPQIYEHPETGEIQKVGQEFTNTALFQKLRQWMRDHTVATPFLVESRTVNIPMRLGKNCFSWINCHPQLIKKGLRVKE